MTVILVGVGGFIGAITRYLVDGGVSELSGGALPWGTLVVNVSGCLVVGALFALITERAAVGAEWRAPLMIGFVGSYTTFSTLALESWRMVEDGAWLFAGVNLVGSVALGLGAVIAGIALGRVL